MKLMTLMKNLSLKRVPSNFFMTTTLSSNIALFHTNTCVCVEKTSIKNLIMLFVFLFKNIKQSRILFLKNHMLNKILKQCKNSNGQTCF